MWIIKSKADDKQFYLKSNTEFKIGRNFGQITFPNDKSISRKHATIYITLEGVAIEDHKSTYGTFINEGIVQNKKIKSDSKIKLKENDVIKFGYSGNEWTLSLIKYMTCLSTFKAGVELKALEAHLVELNVKISQHWQAECTHLTMPSVTLTVKVVEALAHLRPIVGASYWAECLRCVERQLPLPAPGPFLPRVRELPLSRANFHVDHARATLFRGKKFVFFSGIQMNTFKSIIEAAGGNVYFLMQDKIPMADLCSPNSLVVQYTAHNSQETPEFQMTQLRIEEILRYIATKKCRAIPASEIGLSILHVSTEQYCNPLFSFSFVLSQEDCKDGGTSQAQVQVLAPDTEDMTAPAHACSVHSVFVEETLPDSHNSSSSLSLPKVRTSKTKAISPVFTEPPPKRRMVKRNDTRIDLGESKQMFNFVEEELHSSSKGKQAARETSKEGGLFNFAAETSDNPSQHSPPEEKAAPILNIRKSTKRKLVKTDDGDGKRSNITNSVKTVLPTNTSISEVPTSCWLSKKHNMTTLKMEYDQDCSKSSVESSLLLKLQELDMQPAIIEINNELTAAKISDIDLPSGNISMPSRKNYKKFCKVNPSKPHTEVLSSSMLVEYEGRTAGVDFPAASSDEEDGLASFIIPGPLRLPRPTQSTRSRNRRL